MMTIQPQLVCMTLQVVGENEEEGGLEKKSSVPYYYYPQALKSYLSARPLLVVNRVASFYNIGRVIRKKLDWINFLNDLYVITI